LEELPAYYQAADLFVLPSRSEGVPNVLLEASACGTPWIASNVGGIPEIAHLGASRLVPPGDVAALRQAIREMLENPPPRPNVSPRLRTEAVAELRAYLEETLSHA
jgi:glycosyltransferase involved in cell wall biosynthesis